MWYWHTPFRVTDAERAELRKMGVTTLYVRAGTFTTDGRRAKVVLPQRWETKPGRLRVVLTLNFDPGLVSHLEEIPLRSLAADVGVGIDGALDQAKAAGIEAEGVQLDVDCPTRLLPRYAELLRAIRPHVPGSFSITALPTWLASDEVAEVADAVDFLVPQFYEGRTGRTVADLQPVSDAGSIRRGLARLKRLGRPCYVGIAAYGHAMLYDRAGRLAAMYRGLGPGDALRHPSLRFEAGGPLGESGEDRLVLRAVHPDANGQGAGFRIAYTLPTPEMVRRQMDAFRASRPANALGMILYRFPEPGEAMALPLPSVRAALAGEAPKPSLRVRVATRAVPWAAIGASAPLRRTPRDVSLVAEIAGTTGTAAVPGAISLLVEFDRHGLEGIAPGDFDVARLGSVDPDGRFAPCPPARADAVLFQRHYARSGERLRSGAIELGADGPERARVRWSLRPPGGAAMVEGEEKEIPLEKER
jgi:hypothetical protein